jgi:hypothetical protein
MTRVRQTEARWNNVACRGHDLHTIGPKLVSRTENSSEDVVADINVALADASVKR